MPGRASVARSLVPERLRGLGVLLGQRLHRRIDSARRHALSFEVLDLGLVDHGADLAELGVFGRGELDRLAATVHERLLAGDVEAVPGLAYLLFDAGDGFGHHLLQVGRQLAPEILVHTDAEARDVGVHLGRVLEDAAHLERNAGAAVVDEHAIDGALLQLLDLLGRLHADRRSAERRDETTDGPRGG